MHPFPALQAGMYVEASKAAVKVEGRNKAVTMLLIANSYEQDDLVGEFIRYCLKIIFDVLGMY
jgi:hypothetical protein